MPALGAIPRVDSVTFALLPNKAKEMLFVFFALLAVGTVLVSAGFFIDHYILVDSFNKDKVKALTDSMDVLVKSIGGVFVIYGVPSTWLSLQSVRDGQITERINQAVEHLGDEKLQVRLGGIYALERIARDSERDIWPVMQILTAYVRDNASWIDGRPENSQDIRKPRRTGPSIDIQAILSIVSESKWTFENVGDQRLDLHGTDLRKAYLWEAQLEGLDLWEVHLEEATLGKARLSESDLFRSHLGGAGLFKACLKGSILEEADLNGANLDQADLTGANLKGANLVGATLSGAKLNGANLQESHGLTREQISSAVVDQKTQLPSYLQ